MAIFKVPRITSAQRLALALEASEIVFDTDTLRFFGGDGATLGGNEIGGGGFQTQESFTLTSTELTSKSVTLSDAPNFPATVSLIPVGGIPQINGIDFSVTGQTLTWENLGLDNFLEVGDILVVQY
jgi:hypothetical protein